MPYNTKSLFKGVRMSKFRHVFGTVARKDQCYDNINITKNAHDSNFCAVNPKFLAVVTESCGGGNFIVIPVDKVGRVEVHAGRVTGHKGQIFDLKWNPFNDNVIASCSDDTTIKIWYIPEEGLLSRNMNQPFVDLRGHKRRVGFLEWHPTADNILVSAGSDHLIIVWNTIRAEAIRVIDCHTDVIHSMSFNRDGSLLATTSKDKRLRIIDLRSGKVVSEGLCHHGTKASKVVFLGDSGRLFTVGFSRYSDRQWAVWSQNDLSKPLTIENIDSSSGVLFPFYDHDTRMVYVAGKGDGNIRYYETTDEHPYCHYLSQFLSGLPQRGFGVMPKRGCDVYRCEIARFYKLHATRPVCEPVSMIVPRKSEQFQADIFPDTAAPTPALTAEQWLAGQNRNPILLNLKSGAGARTNKPVFVKPNPGQRQTLAEFNNERKFEFISQENQIDYREIIDNSVANGHNNLSEQYSQNGDNRVEADFNGQDKASKHSGHHSQFKAAKHHFESIDDSPKKSHSNKELPLVNSFREAICKSNSTPSRQRLPWIKDETAEEKPNAMCDIVSTKRLPAATFVTINDDSDDSANTTDDSITEEIFLANINYAKGQGAGHNGNGVTTNIKQINSNGSVSSNLISSSTNDSPSSNESLNDKTELTGDLVDAHLSINPKNERELWSIFQEQRALIHKLRTKVQEKEHRIDELEEFISRLDPKDFVSFD